jgi:flagellar motor switch protein FliN/FliY
VEKPVSANQAGERTANQLGRAIAAGLAGALAAAGSPEARSEYVGAERSSLRATLHGKAASTAGFELRFQGAISGAALLLVRTADLFLLAGTLGRSGPKVDDRISPEVMTACVEYFQRALSSAGEELESPRSGRIECGVPELINPDGASAALDPLGGVYEDAVRLTFQLVVEPLLDAGVQVLASAKLLAALSELLPGHDPDLPAGKLAEPTKSSRAQSAEAVSVSGSEGAGVQENPEEGPRNPKWNVDLILDVELPIVVTFGSTEMQLKDILKLGVGSVIELDKGVNDPVTLVVNDKAIARGEVVMIDGNFGVRVLQVESTAERIRSLG